MMVVKVAVVVEVRRKMVAGWVGEEHGECDGAHEDDVGDITGGDDSNGGGHSGTTVVVPMVVVMVVVDEYAEVVMMLVFAVMLKMVALAVTIVTRWQ